MGTRDWACCWPRPLFLSMLLVLALPWRCDAFYHQLTFLDPVYDRYGHVIGSDRVLEMTDLKSTLLGFGFGLNYSTFDAGPFHDPFLPPFVAQHGPVQSQSRPSTGRRGLGPRMKYQPRVSPRVNPYLQGHLSNIRSPLGGPISLRPHVNSRYTPLTHRRFKRQAIQQPPEVDAFERQIQDHLSKAPFGFANQPFPRHGPFQQGHQRGDGQRPCRPQQSIRCNANTPYRTVDGLCNNLAHPTWGAAMQPFRRLHTRNSYLDGYDIPRMTSSADRRRLLPSPRLVSRLIHEPDRPGRALPELTNLLTMWGQFLDHDITGTPALKDRHGKDLKCCNGVRLTEERQIDSDVFNGGPCHPIYIPPLDRHFRYSCMSFARSEPAPRPRDCDANAARQPREQINMLTAFIDGSQVYGSSLKENRKVRLYRHGMLRVSPQDLLPEDANSTCVKDGRGDYCFQAGEIRVNEHPALATLHTIFHRLHNQMALSLYKIHPGWNDEKIFQEARKIMGAILQQVTFHDWLPIILGPDFMRDSSLTVRGPSDPSSTYGKSWRYDPRANPTVINSFSTAAFRFGHTLIPSTFTVGGQKIRLHRMFNRPKFIIQDGGHSISKFCSGLLHDSIQHPDRFIATDLSDRLFEDKDNISVDLMSLNIQRARDHGLPAYNEFREVCGLPRIKSFEDFYRSDPQRAEIFRRVYEHVDDIDLFSGGISETPVSGGIVGPTFGCIISKQFRNIKFGDRYWLENTDASLAFTPDQLFEIRSYSMAKIMCSMAPLDQVSANVFYRDGAFLPKPVTLVTGETLAQNRYVPCELIRTMDMNAWRDPNAQRRP